MQNNTRTSLLPFIFGIVSTNPRRTASYDQICGEVKAELNNKEEKGLDNLKEEVDKALAEGESTGVLSIKGESIRIPFTIANMRLMPDEKKEGEESDVEGKTKKGVTGMKQLYKSQRPKR